MQAGREGFAYVMKDVYADLKEILIDVRNEDARSITAGYINMLELMIKESTEEMSRKFLKWALYEEFSPQSFENPFWVEVNDISGKGYKNRVKDCYEYQISDDCVSLSKDIIFEINRIISELVKMFPDN